MHQRTVACLMGGAVLAAAQSQVQGPPPAPVLLTTKFSAVLPVIPTATPFAGVETEEGAIIYVRLKIYRDLSQRLTLLS